MEKTQDTIDKTARVADYVFTCPNPRITFPLIFVVGILIFFIISRFTFDLKIFLLVIIPPSISALLICPLTNALHGHMYYRRSTLLMLIVIILMVPFSIVSLFCGFLFELLGLHSALSFYLVYLIILSTAFGSHSKTILISSIYPTLSIITYYLTFSLSTTHLLIFIVFHISFFIGAVFFSEICKKPFRKNFDINGIELMKDMLAHWTEMDELSKKKLESFFDKIGVNMHLDVGVVAFKKKDGNIKGLIVVPGAHPGPFGKLGGSNMGEKIREKMKKDFQIMFFHGASTHDENPVSTKECMKICNAIESCIEKIRYGEFGGFEVIASEVEVKGIKFRDIIFFIHTSSPNSVDDIEYGVLRLIREKIKDKKVILVDAHNCIEPGCGMIHLNTDKCEKLLANTFKCVNNMKDVEKKLKVGFSSVKFPQVHEGDVGPDGVQCIFLESDEKICLILIDGNNMVKGLREEIINRIEREKLCDVCEVCTTDNHIVNAAMGGYNPVGIKTSHDDIINLCVESVKRAREDCEDVVCGGEIKKMKIKVLGPGRTASLTSTINSTISVMKASVIASFFISFLLSYFFFTLIRGI